MSSKEVFVGQGGFRLYSSLEWRLLDAVKQGAAGLRAAASDRGATHAVTVKSSKFEDVLQGKKTKQVQRVSGGFYSSSTDQSPGRKGHSIAAAFAKWSHEHEKAALCLTVPDVGFCVVVVLNGLPVLDRYVPLPDQAFALMAGYMSDNDDMSVFADDQVRFPTSLLSEGLLDAIIESCDKSTLIKSIPPDMVKIGIAMLVIAGLAGGYFYYDKQKKAEARKLAILKAEEENPIPKYLNGLAAQRASLGFERKALLAAFQFASALPIDADGWKAKSIVCGRTDAVPEGCSATYERKAGTFTDIREALPKLTMTNPEGSLDLNTAQMTWPQKLEFQPIGDDAPALDEFIRGTTGSQLQNWLVAGLPVEFRPAALWPAVPGVPPSFKHPQALAVGGFSIAGVSLPLFEEVLNTAPANVIWTGWQITIGEIKKGDDPMDSAKIKLIGSYYVKN